MQVMEEERIWAARTLQTTNIRGLNKNTLLEVLGNSSVPFPGKENFIIYLSQQPAEVVSLFLEDLAEADHLEGC